MLQLYFGNQSFKAPDNSGVERGIASILNSVGNVKSQRNLDKLIAETPWLKNRPQLSEENQGIMDHAKRVLGLGPRIGQPQTPVQTQQTMPAQEQPQATAETGVIKGGPFTGNYYATLENKESSGNPNAKAETSSATGLGQFTNGTWRNMMQKHPDLGLTANGRTDPEQSRRAIVRFTEDNAKVLRNNGIDANDKNLYMTHFLGAGDAPNFIRAVMQDPSVRADSLVQPESAAANKTIFYNKDGSPRSAGQVYGMLTRKFGGGSSMADTPLPNTVQYQPAGLQGAPQQAAPNIDPAVLMGIMRSDSAPPAMKQWAAQFMPQPAQAPKYDYMNTQQGLVRTSSTGEVMPVPGYENQPKQEIELLKGKNGQPIGFYDKSQGRLLSPEEAQARGLNFNNSPQGSMDNENFDDEHKLRSQFKGDISEIEKIDGAYDRIRSSAETPSAAGDLALIFNYMKMLDPGSVVREGEFATAQNSAGVPERIRAYYNNIMNGQRLTPEIRKDFLNQAGAIHKGQIKRYNDFVERHRTVAKRYGYNPDNIAVRRGDYDEMQPQPPQQPPPSAQTPPQYSGGYAAASQQPQGQAPQQNIPAPRTAQEFADLPVGTVFIDPLGMKRTKKAEEEAKP